MSFRGSRFCSTIGAVFGFRTVFGFQTANGRGFPKNVPRYRGFRPKFARVCCFGYPYNPRALNLYIFRAAPYEPLKYSRMYPKCTGRNWWN